jgi:hypothetical protein
MQRTRDVKLFPEWMRLDASQNSAAIDKGADPEANTDTPTTKNLNGEKITSAEYADHSSYGWSAKDSFERKPQDLHKVNSSAQHKLLPEHPDYVVPDPDGSLSLRESRADDSGENRGVDPYNTGRFVSK